jgi:two-component system, NtrC family, response regulator AtoC
VVRALTCGGNQTLAAARVGMPRRTFVKRLEDHGIARPRKK